MIRKLLVVGLVVLVGMSLGCGRRETALTNATEATDTDLGPPSDWPDGATKAEGQMWIVNTVIEGEKRLMAVYGKVPGKRGGEVQYDKEQKIFYAEGRAKKYDLQGNARHKIPTGPHMGEPGFPLARHRIKLDKKTGRVILPRRGRIEDEDDRENPRANAYIVIE